MQSFVLVIHVLATLAIVVLVLLQHGKGADAGAAFGTGSAGSLFGSAGSANFLSRSTSIAAAVFFCTSLVLTYFGTQRNAGSVIQKTPATQTAPAKADAKPGEAKADAKPDAKTEQKTDTKTQEIPK
jgi:preprotein translocase subunit SecG